MEETSSFGEKKKTKIKTEKIIEEWLRADCEEDYLECEVGEAS